MYRTIDAQVAGEAVRLVVEGAPVIKGRTMADKLAWLRKHGAWMRETLMLEPRGHAGMHGALFTEPVSAGAHAGILFLNAAEFPLLSGEAIMAAAAIGAHENILHVGGDILNIETPVGIVSATLHPDDRSGGSMSARVSLGGLTGFVQAAAVPVQIGGRTARADIAFGGESYVIIDSEAVGVSIDPDRAPELVRTAARVCAALGQTRGVIFTSPARDDGHLRTATVLDGGVLRRSPGAAGTIALMAVLDAMGILAEGQTFINEGLVGTTLEARVLRHQLVDDKPTIDTCVEGSVSITGRHEFFAQQDEARFRI